MSFPGPRPDHGGLQWHCTAKSTTISGFHMAEDVDIEYGPAYVRVRASGRFNLQRAKDNYDRILDACDDHGQSRVLIDVREMSGDIPIIDRYAFSQHMARVRRQGFRIAFVGTREQVLPDKFLETAANNLGVPTFVATSVDEAVQWLEKR